MRIIFSFLLIVFSLSIHAQDVDWKEVIKADNIRNFVGHLGASSTDLNACQTINGTDYHLLSLSIKADAKTLIDHILTQDNLDLSQVCTDKTILMYAIKYGEASLVKTLIEKGADVSQLSTQGKSALEYARKYEKKDIYDYLNTL